MIRLGWIAAAGAASLILQGCGGMAFDDKSTRPQSSPADSEVVLPRAEQPADCPVQGAALQVLGSGGPIAEGGIAARAGTSYLLRLDGEPRLLIDAGAGSYLRFAQAGGSIASLDAILITHLHADHAGDLTGVLNSGGFEGRTAPLPVIGPDGAPRFAGTAAFLARLMSKETGAFAYNGGFLDGSENKPQLQPRDIPTDQGAGAPAGLDLANEYSVTAHPVHHGPVPALGYAIEIDGKSIVITGDQSFLSERFLTDLSGTKPAILFAHHVINGEDGQPRGLHRTPAQIGELAGALGAERLVLTHNMLRSLNRIESGLASIGEGYDGPVSVADDLDCYAL